MKTTITHIMWNRGVKNVPDSACFEVRYGPRPAHARRFFYGGAQNTPFAIAKLEAAAFHDGLVEASHVIASEARLDAEAMNVITSAEPLIAGT